MLVQKMSKIFFVIVINLNLLCIPCYAEDVIFLPKGSTTQYDGYLFTPEKALKTRKELIELDYIKLENDSQKKSLDLFKLNDQYSKDKIQLLLDQNDKLAKSLYEARELTNWEKVGLFTLGVAVTGLAIYGARQTLVK